MQADYPAKEFKAATKRKTGCEQASQPSQQSQPSMATAAKSAARKEPADEPTDMPDEDPTSKPDKEQKTKPDNETTTKPENEATTKPENEATTKPNKPPVKQHVFHEDTTPSDSDSDLEDVLIDQSTKKSQMQPATREMKIYEAALNK